MGTRTQLGPRFSPAFSIAILAILALAMSPHHRMPGVRALTQSADDWTPAIFSNSSATLAISCSGLPLSFSIGVKVWPVQQSMYLLDVSYTSYIYLSSVFQAIREQCVLKSLRSSLSG